MSDIKSNYFSPAEVVAKVGEAAMGKAQTSTLKTLLLAFLAGTYIALGGLLAVVISGGAAGLGMTNPGIQKFLMGAAFPLGLMLCAIAGADLFTGNTAYFVPPVMAGKLKITDMLRNWALVYVGNFIGSLFVAYFMTYLTDVLATTPWTEAILHLAEKKTSAPFYKVFLKGIGANWFVALAMWMAYAAKDLPGKMLGIWFPVMAFVTIGFEHSIANMFFIPTAIFYGSPVSWSQFFVNNLIPATLGNIVGGSLLVGAIYGFVYPMQKCRENQ
jgi:formate/nitrite transporter